MVAGIYLIKNTKNGKVYVGQTVNIKTRWKSHLHLLRNNKHGNKHLQASFNKYGEQYFTFTIIEHTNDLNNREIFWIKTFGGIESKSNYNKSTGGDGGGKRNIETRIKISKWQTGRTLTKEHSENIANANRGKKRTDELKKRMSDLYKGRPLLESTKLKISQSKKGIKLSDSTRFKLKGRGSKPVLQYDISGIFISDFESAKEAGRLLNFWKSDITQCCMGKRKTVKGYIFKYKI